MVKITQTELSVDVAQLEAVLNGTVVSHGTAILDLQNGQVNLQAGQASQQTEIDNLDTRVTALETP